MKTEIFLDDWALEKVSWVQGGDADVNTKNGRNTKVDITVDRLRVSPCTNYVLARVTYSVKELSSNYTKLSSTKTVEIPIPQSDTGTGEGTFVRLISTVGYTFSKVIPGKDHEWHDIATPSPNCIVKSGEFKFDGSGRDDKGNAQLKLSFRGFVEIRNSIL